MMEKINTIKINTNNLLANIKYLKSTYPYEKYIIDVSNQAFFHGMYIIQYLKEAFDYFYVHDFADLLLVRKYASTIPVIYDGEINEDNIYDLLINNAILVIREMSTLNHIRNMALKDNVAVILAIDPQGLRGISRKEEVLACLEGNTKHFELLGIIATLEEEEFAMYKEIVKPLTNIPIRILNQENDKRKIQGSNTLKLDYSVYGINNIKKKILKKNDKPLKQVLGLYSKVGKIKEETFKNKSKYTAVVPFGYHHGMNEAINKVFINNHLYPVFKITNEFSYILVDENIKENMLVEITSANNPLESYFNRHTLNYFSLFYHNLSIVYDDYVLDKEYIY